MGLAPQVVEAIVREHAYRPIVGDVLLIGRQTVYMTPEHLIGMVRSHGLSPAIDPMDVALDRDTVNRRPGVGPQELVSDLSLFALLGNRKVKALDHSDYEGAEVVHDLTTEVPEHLKGCTDFIVDGSTLDNTFNPALTLKNYADLLRPGGRLVAVNTWSNHFEPYVMLSPAWYLDYFVMNRFADCKVYIIVHIPNALTVFCVNPDCLLDPSRKLDNFKAPYEMAVVVVAEKGADSTSAIWPSQAHYRSEATWKTYRDNLANMGRSTRPHVVRTWGPGMSFTEVVSGYLYVDGDFTAHEPASVEQRMRALEAEREARRKFESSIAGRTERLLKRLVRPTGYELVWLPEAERATRAAELDSLFPHTLAGNAKRRVLRLLQKTGYGLAKPPSAANPKFASFLRHVHLRTSGSKRH